jgi:hypothetical protein
VTAFVGVAASASGLVMAAGLAAAFLSSRKSSVLWGILVLLPVLGVAAVYLLWPKDPPGTVGQPAKPPFLTVFMIDGLAPEVFERELSAGHLPNMARLKDEGLYIPHGIGSFPSMSGYGFYPFHTGHDAAESGILGLRWFDRHRDEGPFRQYVGKTNILMNGDLLPSPKTVFEHFSDAHSFSVNSYNNRGVHRERKTAWLFTMAKYKDHWWLAGLLSRIPILHRFVAPDWPEVEAKALELAIDDLKNQPKVQWITLVSPDTYSHVYGLGPRYPELVRHLDHLIGVYRQASTDAGLEKDRIYAVVTDHGVAEVSKNADLLPLFASAGIRAFRGEATRLLSGKIENSLAQADFDVLIAINGNLSNLLYFRNPAYDGAAAWKNPPNPAQLRAYPSPNGPVDVVTTLLAAPSVEHVIIRGHTADDFEVHGRDGVGRIRQEGPADAPSYRYTVEGRDPLGYEGHIALVDGQAHDASAWLQATHATDFPDALYRIVQVMRQTTAPDVIVTSRQGWDLADDYELFVGVYRGGHGGLRADQIRVPYLLAGPGIPKGETATARAEDVGATLLRALDVPLDGRSGHPINK